MKNKPKHFAGEGKKCDYCKNPAIYARSDPFRSDVYDDDSDRHFWCDNPRCEARCKEDCHQSAMDI